MRRCLITQCLVFLCLAMTPIIHAQDLLWVGPFSGTDAQTADDIVVDGGGHVITVGFSGGTADFDPGPGTLTLTGTGIAITKLDRDGAIVWAKQITMAVGKGEVSVAIDDEDHVYVGGNFEDPADVDPGPGMLTLTPIAGTDFFVCKLDRDGNLVWAAQMGGTGNDRINDLMIDSNGDVVLTGQFSGTMDFDPGPGTLNLTSAGNLDGFVAKLDSAGNLLSAGGMGGTGRDLASGVATNSANDIYVVGFFNSSSADFDPGPGAFIMSNIGFNNAFMVKLDVDGNFVWANGFFGSSVSESYRVAVDGDDNVLTIGQFNNTVDFDPGSGTANLTVGSWGAVFVSKLDGDGTYLWAKQMWSMTSGVIAAGMAVDRRNSIYATGWFQGTIDFDPGPGTFELTAQAFTDGFVAKLDGDGGLVWAHQLRSNFDVQAWAVALDETDATIVSGWFSGQADFDPGSGTMSVSADGTDAYAWKFGSTHLRLGSQAPTEMRFSPDSPGVSFDLVTGHLSDLRADEDYDQASCLGSFSGNPAIDASVPPLGEGFYYIARGLSCCTSQGYGNSTLSPDPRDDLDAFGPCP